MSPPPRLVRRLLPPPLLLAIALGGCHPGACLYPRAYPSDPPTELSTLSSRWPEAAVDVIYDDFGVPHIYGETETDLAYAQGFVHGRDRLTQMVLRRAFAWGRLTELVGTDALDSDRITRLYTWNIDEEMEGLRSNERSYDLLEAYAAGVNLGAEEAGQTPELWAAGLTQGLTSGHEFEPWTPEDSVAFNRAFSFLMSAGAAEELARRRIENRIPESDPRQAELLETIGSLGAPVVLSDENTGDTGPITPAMAQPRPAVPGRGLDKEHPAASPPSRLLPTRIRRLLGFPHFAGSNAWAVAPEHTAAGVPVLANDPHLTHDGPSFWHLVHLESSDGFVAAGASIPGLPGVGPGVGRHVAFGVTVNNVDTQDLVKITPYDGRDDLYLLDARPEPYGTLKQTFKLGPHESSPVIEEEWKTTVFGPLLPSSWGHLHDEGELYALLWPGFDHLPDPDGTPARHDSSLVFWEVAKAPSVEAAIAAIDPMVTLSLNVVLADDSGHIGYALAGQVPVRETAAPAGRVRDGRTSDAGWTARLPGVYRPELLDPASGLVVAANQRVVEPDGPRAELIGEEANLPYRAARIRERLEDLLDDGPASTADILAIQQDALSLAGRDLGQAFAAACPGSLRGFDDEVVQAACDAIAAFDGEFTTESAGAVLVRRLERVMRRLILTAHLGEEVAVQIQGHHFVRFNVHRRILEEAQGVQTALVDDPETDRREGLEGFLEEALAEVLDTGLGDPALGPDPLTWRWGAVHTLRAEGRLAEVPGVGLFFQTAPTEEPGCGTCVRAEAGDVSALPPDDPDAVLNPDKIFAGASLRMVAEMTTPPVMKMILDTGQAGDFGHPHFEDQKERWRTGTPDDLLELIQDRSTVEANAVQRVRLLAP